MAQEAGRPEMAVSSSVATLAETYLRDLILERRLAPGAKLNLDQIAATLAISRTPIRAALSHLQAQGLVHVVPRVGVYVRAIAPEEVLEVYSIKASLEPLMARWATERSTPAERAAYADSAATLAELSAGGDSAPYVQLVIARRDHMMSLARSEILTALFRQVDHRVQPLRDQNLRHAERRTASLREHLKIAHAVRVGEAALAADLTRAHVEAAQHSLLRTLASNPTPSTERARS